MATVTIHLGISLRNITLESDPVGTDLDRGWSKLYSWEISEACAADHSIVRVLDVIHGPSPIPYREATPECLDNLLGNRKTWDRGITSGRP